MTVSHPTTQKTPAKSKPAIARTHPVTILFWFFLLLFKRKTNQFPQTQQSKSRKSPKIRKGKRKKKQFVILGVCFISMKVLEPRVSTGPFTKSSYANKPTVFFFSGASLQWARWTSPTSLCLTIRLCFSHLSSSRFLMSAWPLSKTVPIHSSAFFLFSVFLLFLFLFWDCLNFN